jgi:hypothetical protein
MSSLERISECLGKMLSSCITVPISMKPIEECCIIAEDLSLLLFEVICRHQGRGEIVVHGRAWGVPFGEDPSGGAPTGSHPTCNDLSLFPDPNEFHQNNCHIISHFTDIRNQRNVSKSQHGKTYLMT